MAYCARTIEIIRREIHAAELRIAEQVGRYIKLKVSSGKEMQTADSGDMYVIMATVAEALGMTMDDYYEGRQPKYVDLRTVAVMFIRKLFPKTSYAKIAAGMDLLDHTSVLHMLQRGENMIFTRDKEFCEKYRAAAAAIDNYKKQSNATGEDSHIPGREMGAEGGRRRDKKGVVAGRAAERAAVHD